MDPPTKKRKYTGPAKGSEEAKECMAKVRQAQWDKNGLVSKGGANAGSGDDRGTQAP